MQSYLIANPPTGPFLTGLAVGLIIVAGLTARFLRRRCRGRPGRWAVLAATALVLGPLCGVGLAAVALLSGDVSPLDWASHFRSFAIVGLIAGVVGAIMIAAIAGPSGTAASEQPGDRDPAE
jgi:hypothetical protein